jgi:hypothetical protein
VVTVVTSLWIGCRGNVNEANGAANSRITPKTKALYHVRCDDITTLTRVPDHGMGDELEDFVQRSHPSSKTIVCEGILLEFTSQHTATDC